MKRLIGKSRKLVKGMPSAVVLSILIHAALFLLAGMLVVFTVQKKEEKKFVPPKAVERPKMNLRKPKVKVKKTSKPKPSTRIVTKVKRASMPNIQLPEMSGMAEGLVGGIGGFDLMPDLGEVSVFGSGQSIGNDFVGTFYDFKRDRRGRPLPTDPNGFSAELAKFVRDGWKISHLAKYYRSPKKLYATTFMIPVIRSSVAPAAFDEAETIGYAWMVHYKGQLVYHEDIKFRFWGMGDDVMVIRVGGKVVLSACWPDDTWGASNIGGSWSSSAKNDFRFYLGNNLSRGGDWIELKAGEPQDMEIIIGEGPGGGFCSMLTVEVEGVEYEKNRQGGPIFPIFKTAEPSLDLMDAIYRDMVPGEASVTNGPVFRDYVVKTTTNQEEQVEMVDGSGEGRMPESAMHIWTSAEGKKIEAEYVSTIGDKVVLKTPAGKQQKISLAQLSPADCEYIELENPPTFDITFTKSSAQRIIETTPFLNEEPPRINDITFGAKLTQRSAHPYDHELTVEFFAIAQELIGDKYILVDRQASTFTPTRENRQSHEFKGKEVEFMESIVDEMARGMMYSGNLVTVSDKRGKVIQYSASNPWLWENIENLRQIPVGRYMDKNCIRVHPTSPPATRY